MRKLLRKTNSLGFVEILFDEVIININPKTLDVYTPKMNIAKWNITPGGYMQCVIHIPLGKSKRRMYAIYEHRLIVYLFGDKHGNTINHLAGNRMIDNLVIDHIDSNKLNNSISNLQVQTNRQNGSREKVLKSGLPVGVHWNKKQKMYQSYISKKGKMYHLGYFKTQNEASVAYQEKLKELTA